MSNVAALDAIARGCPYLTMSDLTEVFEWMAVCQNGFFVSPETDPGRETAVADLPSMRVVHHPSPYLARHPCHALRGLVLAACP